MNFSIILPPHNMKKHEYIKKAFLILLFSIVFTIGYIVSGTNYIPPHYHTNFAVFIEWEKFDFTDDKYSEDVASCSAWDEIFPKDRTHLHENNGDTIHVHHGGVTWGHFFANNGITFSNTHISFDSWQRILTSDETNTLTFVLNGEVVSDPFNRYMLSEDKLLVSYWTQSADEAIAELYPQIVSNAWEYNEKYDPGSCAGTDENVIWHLFKKMFHSKLH